MDLLVSLVIAIDGWQRRKRGIWEFSDDPHCILRLRLATARNHVRLDDGTVLEAGDPVGELHLWNEQMPQIPGTGRDVAWARGFYRSLTHSLRLLAQSAITNPAVKRMPAFYGTLTLAYTPASIAMWYYRS